MFKVVWSCSSMHEKCWWNYVEKYVMCSDIRSNHEAYHSGNLPHIPKLTSSSHVHHFGIKNPKNHCFINVSLQLIYSVLRSTQQKMHINNCVEGKILECLFDTAHKTPSAQEVETLKLQLSTYNSFFTGEIQEDACECLMLLIEIMDKGSGHALLITI